MEPTEPSNRDQWWKTWVDGRSARIPHDFSAQGPVEHLICQHQQGSEAKPVWKVEESRRDNECRLIKFWFRRWAVMLNFEMTEERSTHTHTLFYPSSLNGMESSSTAVWWHRWLVIHPTETIAGPDMDVLMLKIENSGKPEPKVQIAISVTMSTMMS